VTAEGHSRAPRMVIEGCAIVAVDAAGTELTSGHLIIEGDRGTSRPTGTWTAAAAWPRPA
jgi:hypothetical protein